MSLKFIPTGFLDIATDSSILPKEVSDKIEVSGAMRSCTNLHLDKSGVASTRRGSSKINATTMYQTTPTLLMEQNGDRYVFGGGTIYKNENPIDTGYSTFPWSAIKYNPYNSIIESIYALNGADRIRISGTDIYQWGLEPPGFPITCSAGSKTGLTGSYDAEYSFAKKDGDIVISESNPSPANTETTSLTDQSLNMKITPPDNYVDINTLRIYRTDLSGVHYYFDRDLNFMGDIDYSYTYLWEDGLLTGMGYHCTSLISSSPKVISYCDTLSDGTGTWDIASGAGVAISINTVTKYEGAGSLKIIVPESTTAIVVYTITTAVDLSSYNSLNAWFYV
jgi:hypothetical protein